MNIATKRKIHMAFAAASGLMARIQGIDEKNVAGTGSKTMISIVVAANSNSVVSPTPQTMAVIAIASASLFRRENLFQRLADAIPLSHRVGPDSHSRTRSDLKVAEDTPVGYSWWQTVSRAKR
jgi:hypothetical protein